MELSWTVLMCGRLLLCDYAKELRWCSTIGPETETYVKNEIL